MRIASGILGLVLMLGLGAQSLLIAVGTNITGQKTMGEAAALGLAGAFLFLVGGAFAFGLPTVAVACFGLAALFLLAGASISTYHDLYIWMVAAIVLCALAWGGRIEKARKRTRQAIAQDEQARALLYAQQAALSGSQPQQPAPPRSS